MILQLALSARDAGLFSGTAYRARLGVLRSAIDAELAALDAAERPPEAAAPVRPPPAEPSFWQRLARDRGEVLIVLESESLPSGVRRCARYAVAEGGASAWELANQIKELRAEP